MRRISNPPLYGGGLNSCARGRPRAGRFRSAPRAPTVSNPPVSRALSGLRRGERAHAHPPPTADFGLIRNDLRSRRDEASMGRLARVGDKFLQPMRKTLTLLALSAAVRGIGRSQALRRRPAPSATPRPLPAKGRARGDVFSARRPPAWSPESRASAAAAPRAVRGRGTRRRIPSACADCPNRR